MSRRKRRQEVGVTLFPFLAVLVCTMGILIVMLVIAVKAADDTAAAEVAKSDLKQEELENLQIELQDFDLKNETLLDRRPQLREKLSRARSQRGHVEEEIRRLKRKLSASKISFDELSKKVAEQPAEDSEKEIARLSELIESTRLLLDEKQRELTESKELYSIVPYQGGSGTMRRPIYLECDANGIVFQPYGIRLDENDFTFPLLAGNPLDRSLLAIREYMNRNKLNGDRGSAYPLIVVRPGGESYFALIRRAMINWDDEFGYELIEESKELDFGDIDLNLVDVVQETIKESLSEQRQMVAVMESRGQRFAKLRAGSELNQSGNSGIGSGASGDKNDPLMPRNENSMAQSLAESENGENASIYGGDFKPPNSDSESSSDDNKIVESQQSTSANATTRFASQTKTDSTQSGNGTSNAAQQTGNERSTGQEISPSIERGENWALPSSTAQAVAYHRPIRVVCRHDRLVIEPGDNSNLSSIEIPVKGSVDQSMDEFVQSIWTVIDSWGIAGPGGYWKPVLSLNIMPGGQTNNDRLRFILKDSGLGFEKP